MIFRDKNRYWARYQRTRMPSTYFCTSLYTVQAVRAECRPTRVE